MCFAFARDPRVRHISPMAQQPRSRIVRDLGPNADSSRALRSWYGDTAASAAEGFEFTRHILHLPAMMSTDEVLTELER